jgi:serine protease Do
MISQHLRKVLKTTVTVCVFAISSAFTQETASITVDESKEIPAGEEEAIHKTAPESIEDLVAVQRRVSQLMEKSMAATVGILSNGTGSGVLISEDGYILTAGHVSGDPNEEILVVMHDGKHLKAKSLGHMVFADAGLVKLEDDGPFPYVDMATAEESAPGDWCYVLGNPGGIDEQRGLVLRIGRVIRREAKTMQTDCRLIGGDSGGPLFNMNGEVIGINSRIKPDIVGNYHVTIGVFKRYWEDLRDGKLKHSTQEYIEKNGGYLGVATAMDARGVLITRVLRNSPAQKMGMRSGDIVLSVDGKSIETTTGFTRAISGHAPEETVSIEIMQRGKKRTVEVELEPRPTKES